VEQGEWAVVGMKAGEEVRRAICYSSSNIVLDQQQEYLMA
jgi:hypothetical protein